LTCHAETIGLMAGLTIGGKNLFAAIARREFRRLLCALRSTGFFHRLRLAAVRVERFAAEVSRVTTEIGAAKKYRQPVNCNQPNRERFPPDPRFALFALHGSVNLLHVCQFVVIHSLANARCRFWSFLVHCVVILPALATARVIRRVPELLI
jgi:hypothetical protein